MEVDYRKYQYHIATPPFDENTHSQLYKKVIPYWRNFWVNLLKELGSTEGFQEDELHWQSCINYITHEQRLVGLYFIARYKTEEFLGSEYGMRYLPAKANEILDSYKGEYINTLQYFSVDSAYSYRKTGINFASVLSDTSTLHQRELCTQKTIAVIRKAIGMHNMARKVGFQEYCTAKKHGVAVSVMHNSAPQRYPKNNVVKISDYLWKNRNIINKEKIVA